MTNSSSDDEEVSTEGSESESESDVTPPPQPSSRKTLAVPQLSSEESESDADSPPKKSEKADPNIKPLASKPMDDEPSKKPKNPISRNSPPPAKPVNGKRKSAEVGDEPMASKLAKKEGVEVAAPVPENAGEKKQLFQRLWSEDDEIVLIKGMINYVETKGKDPIADVNDFHEFVKNSLNVDVNNGQMTAKVKRLKAKFKNNVGKIEQNGKVRSLSNPHEKKMYELSETLWGGDNNKNAAIVNCTTKKANPKPTANQKLKENCNAVASGEIKLNGGLESGKNVMHSMGGIRIPITDEDIMNRGLELLSGPKKVELEEKWNDLKVQELKHYLKKLELLKEQGELVLNAIKKSGATAS